MIQTFPQTAPVHQLQKGYRSLLNQVKKTKQPLFLLKNNYPESVLLDFSYWENWTKVIRQWEEADLNESISLAEQELKEGKIKKLTSLKDLINE